MLVQSNLEHIPIGDLDFLKHIAEVSSVSLAINLVENAPAAVTKELNAIKHAIDVNDTEQLKDACHALRGACYSVRVIRLADMASKMEEKASDISSAEKMLFSLEEISEQTIAWWRDVLDKKLIQN